MRNANTRLLRIEKAACAACLLVIGLLLLSRPDPVVAQVTGSGATNQIPKWSSSSSLTNSAIYDGGTGIGIGTTSPATGALFHMKTADVHNVVIIDSGSSMPRLSDLVFMDRGIYKWELVKTEGNDFGLFESGVDYRILVKPGGNMGLGTLTPVDRLDIVGRLHVSGVCGGGVPNLQGTYLSWNQLCGSGEADLINHQGGGTGGFAFHNTTNGSTLTTLMRITGGGNVGIGTIIPAALLHIVGTNDTNGIFEGAAGTKSLIQFRNAGTSRGYVGYANTGSTGLGFFNTTGATINMLVTDAGRVGIGTTSPSTSLHVVGDITATGTGNITATGVINAKYQDLAEWVPARLAMPAGTVVVLDPEQSNHVMPADHAYDTRVAGVISQRPGLILGEGGEGKVMVATTGRVRVKVDATSAPIRVGDLLVTSDNPGVAMRSKPLDLAGTPIHRPGTLIGKALEPLAGGVGEILVLLSLQ